MGTLTTGIGLISGIDTASLIDALITLESGGKTNLQTRLAILQSQQTALMDINARLLNLKTTSLGLRTASVFQSALAKSSDADILTASATGVVQPGSYSFLVKQIVSSSQKVSKGFTDAKTAPVGLSSLSFELGKGKVSTDTELADLNGGAGAARGKIIITDGDGDTTVDLSTATTIDEVLDAINGSGADVTASVDGDHLVITENDAGDAVAVANAAGYTTATDLGIVKSGTGSITGDDIRTLGGLTTLASLNDGTGVNLYSGGDDLAITARDGTVINIDLGRVNNPIDGDTLIEDLNNGSGITLNSDSTEDIKFVDRDGVEHEVNLTGIVTVQDFMDRVDDQTDGAITISVTDGNKFTVNDTTGGTEKLKVLGAGPNETDAAEDFGILNVEGEDAASFDGSVLINADHTPAALTIQNVIDKINNDDDNGGEIVASIGADGVSLLITDTTGSTANNLIVTSTTSNPYAARDLGIDTGAPGVDANTVAGDRLIAGLNSVLLTSLNGGSGVAGLGPGLTSGSLLADLLDGAGIDTSGGGGTDMRIRDREGNPWVDLDLDSMTTVQDLIDAVATGSGGNLSLEIEGTALRLNDHTGSTANDLEVQNRGGTTAATDLGIEGDHAADTVLGDNLGPLPTRSFDITDRSGASANINLVDPKSLAEVIIAINNAGIGVVASLNDAGNGLLITDTTGATASNLIVSDTLGSLAADLGISGDVADTKIRGGNLQHRYVAEGTRLSELNYGRGIGTGEFRITDGDGDQVTIEVDSDIKTVADLIEHINSQAGVFDVNITARVNDNGDGIQIDNDLGTGLIQVDSLSGTTASNLNLVGQAETDGGSIDGSYETVITLNASDTVNEIVEAINEAGIPVSASTLNSGVGGTPIQMIFTSEISGTTGDLVIDDGGFGLGLTTLSEARDAKVFFGSQDPAQATLIKRSTNTLDNVVPGVSIDLVSASDTAVTLNVSRDTQTIVDKIAEFAAAFNDAVGRIDQYDYYNVETEEKGILLGNGTASQVRNALFRTVQQKATGVEGRYQYLSQVGLTVGSGGVVQFDRAKFQEAYDTDAEAVEDLFTAFQGSTTTSGEIFVDGDPLEGVTIEASEQTYSQLGFGDLFDRLLDGLTNSSDGTVTLADEAIQSQIDLTSDRIEAFDERLEAKRLRLQREFTAMETALALLQNQANALSSLVSNLSLTQSRL